MINLSHFANKIRTSAPAPKASLVTSVPYTDRSNCRRAMLQAAEKAGKLATDYVVISTMEGYRYRPTTAPAAIVSPPAATPAPSSSHPLDIPETLKRPRVPGPVDRLAKMAADTAERTIKHPPDVKRGESHMRTFGVGVSLSQPKKFEPLKDGRSRYDWAGAEEMARKGKLPPLPNSSAENWQWDRETLAAVHEAAKSKDIAALKAFQIKPYNTMKKTILRYRNLCLVAVKAGA